MKTLIATLAHDRDDLKKICATVTKQRDEFKKGYEIALLELERLRRGLFGKKSEHMSEDQLALVFEQFEKLIADAAPPAPPSEPEKPARKRHAHGRRSVVSMDNLPLETIELTPPNVPADAVRMGADTSYSIEYRRASFVRLCIVRPKYAVGVDAAVAEQTGANRTVLTAEKGPEMIVGGLAGPAFLAHVIVSKFADHIPFHRQESMLARQGIELSRGTMCQWAFKCHELAHHVVDAMKNDAITNASVIATDATGILVQNAGGCKRGHFWVAIADRDHVFYRYTEKHNSEAPKTLFAGFSGYLQADASSVYHALFREPDGPTEVACWSHARRKFFDAIGSDKERALIAIRFINTLFDLERAIKNEPPDKRLRVRATQSAPVLEKLKAWRDAASTSLEPRTPIARALGYLARHWDALTRFLSDAKLRLDNNPSELALRHVVVGRKNWLFVGSDESAPATATFVSLVASCKLHGIEPEGYLRDLFRILPAWPKNRLLELSPKYWVATRARIDQAALAAPLGPIAVPPAPAQCQAEQLRAS